MAAPNLSPAAVAAVNAGVKLHRLADVLRAVALGTHIDWPPAELAEARAALVSVVPTLSREDALVRSRATDQAALLLAMPRAELLKNVAYWEACAETWATWARERG